MKRYIVNTTPDNKGDHEVHDESCHRLPSPENQKDLGHHSGCYSAVIKAKASYPTANGCYYCSRECHTT